MALFFFHTQNGAFFEDEDGVDLPNTKAARALARRAAAEWLNEDIDGLLNRTGVLTVVDGTGREVYRLRLELSDQ